MSSYGLPPLRGVRWLMCELFHRRHAYRQDFVLNNEFYDEDMYVSVCRRCGNVQSGPVWVHSWSAHQLKDPTWMR